MLSLAFYSLIYICFARVYFAKYDESQNTIEKLRPFEGQKHFYENECIEIENMLGEALEKEINKSKINDK